MYKLDKEIRAIYDARADIKIDLEEVSRSNEYIYEIEHKCIERLRVGQEIVRMKLYENNESLNDKEDYDLFYQYLISHHVRPFHFVIEEINECGGYKYYFLTVDISINKSDSKYFIFEQGPAS